MTIVHHAYAVMVNTTHSDPVAFCLLHKFSSRLTWAVLPWSVALLAWLGPHARIMHIKVNKHPYQGVNKHV